MKAKPPAARRRTSKRTELRSTSAQAARRLAKEAEEREWRVFLTALLGPEQFSTYLAELVESPEAGSDPGAFWAKWIDVVIERTPPEPTKAQ